MATPITVTVGQAFGFSGGKSCKPIYDLLAQLYPDYTEDTELDGFTWTEQQRAAGLSAEANYGLYRALSPQQQGQFILWALNAIVNNATNEYGRKAEMVALVAAVQSYMQAPTQQKKDALLATAKEIKPNTSEVIEMVIANALKGVAVSVANNKVTGSIIYELGQSLVKGGVHLGSKTRTEVNDIILTKLQQIVGIRD